MATRKKPVTEAQPPEPGTNLPNISAVRVNREALATTVLYGSRDRVGTVYRECMRTLYRLGLTPKKVKALPVPDEEVGTLPNTLDLQRWLDSLDEDHTDDLSFVMALVQTSGQRVTAAFKQSIKDELLGE